MTSEQLMAGLIVFTNLFWSYTAMTLLNKLMSRNYHEYVVSRAVETASKRPRETPKPSEEEFDGVYVPMG